MLKYHSDNCAGNETQGTEVEARKLIKRLLPQSQGDVGGLDQDAPYEGERSDGHRT